MTESTMQIQILGNTLDSFLCVGGADREALRLLLLTLEFLIQAPTSSAPRIRSVLP